jgi:hypothetical protein
MPFNVNGIGTTYYSRREFRPDGSYLTTEWIIFLMLPISLLRTFRQEFTPLCAPRPAIKHNYSNSQYGFMGSEFTVRAELVEAHSPFDKLRANGKSPK